MRRGMHIGIALAAISATSVAAAHSVRLTYIAQAPCPSRDEFVELMRRRLTTLEMGGENAMDVAVTLREAQPGTRYVGRLIIDGKTDAAREVDGASCAEVAEATALAV